MYGDKLVQAIKSIHFDRIKRPKLARGRAKSTFREVLDKVQFGVGRKVYQLITHTPHPRPTEEGRYNLHIQYQGDVKMYDLR